MCCVNTVSFESVTLVETLTAFNSGAYTYRIVGTGICQHWRLLTLILVNTDSYQQRQLNPIWWLFTSSQYPLIIPHRAIQLTYIRGYSHWQLSTLIVINSSSYQHWQLSTLTAISNDDYQHWQLPILTAIDTDSYQQWLLSILTAIDTEGYQYWRLPTLTAIEIDGYKYWWI